MRRKNRAPGVEEKRGAARGSQQLEGDDQSTRFYLECLYLVFDPGFVFTTAIQTVDGGLGEEQGEGLVEGGEQGSEGCAHVGWLRLDRNELQIAQIDGTLFGLWLYPDLPLLELAILSTILAPTDAALGKAVVSNPAVPAPIREGLNQESGLNDGICVPVLLLLLALIAPTEQHTGTGMLAMTLLLEEIGIGLLVALVLTSLTIRLLKTSYLNGWQLPLWRQLTMPGLALLCFALAQTLGGSGFIAAFVGGLLMGRRLGEHKHAYMDSCEGYGDLLSVVIWMVFGATLMPMLPMLLHWQYWLYAAASLTLLRMLPVWLSLLGTGQIL